VNLADGREIALQAFARGLCPDPVLRVDEWSEQHMVLPKSAAQSGEYRIERTPGARRIMQCLSPEHPCKRVVVRGASQMFKTQVAINWICGSIHLAPANILALEPTDGLAKRFSARITQTVHDVAVLRDLVSAPRSRDSRNTVAAKDFRGGTLYIATAGSASNLAEIPARYVFVDEVDRLELSVEGEGDPVDLAEARATTFAHRCKFYEVSSPTQRGFSKIDELYAMGTQEVQVVPCPHCDHLHELVIERFHYERDADTGFMSRAWFACPECGGLIEEHHKPRLFAGLQWRANSAGDGETVSFHASAFYAPLGSVTWLSLARQWARAKERKERGDSEAMRVFYNTRLALSYDDTESSTTATELAARAEPYPPRVVPDAALVVTIAVDVQPNRLEVQTEAWGPDLEHWVLDHQVLIGAPTEPPQQPGSVWARLDDIRRTPLPHASGVLIAPSCYAIDSGGANTQDVYNYGATRRHLSALIIKGASRPARPIISSVPSRVDIDWHGRRVAGGVELYTIGTDVAKDHLYNRFRLRAGAGAMHFHSALPAEWFEQLCVERKRVRYRNGRIHTEWVKSNADRNEALDLAVYNLACAHHLGLHKWSAQDWARLRQKLLSATPDLFATGAVAEAARPAAVEPPLPAPSGVPDAAPRPEEAPGASPAAAHQIAEQRPPASPAALPPPPAATTAAPENGRRVLSKGIR
jgi:phage terminase large subunit GpA-like protein